MKYLITNSLRLILLLCIFTGTVESARAQSLEGLDLSAINVEELSDQQIQQYLTALKGKGISESDAEALARQRGVSELKIQQLRKKILEFRSGSNTSGSSVSNGPASANRSVLPSNTTRVSVSTGQGNGIFGTEVFRSGSLTFAPNLSLPTPMDYVLGPGDELRIELWGASQTQLILQVDAEGSVKPNNTGPVYVNGLTIEKAKAKIIDRLSQIYSGLKPMNGKAPSIFYQVSLGQIRTINVELIGAVQKPGSYSLPSLATAYTALQAAGGPSDNGTFRMIKLVRNNQLKATIDVYDYLLSGIKSGNIRLKEGDVILVPNYKRRVDVSGEFRRTGLFELKEDETMESVLQFAGGFNSSAYRKSVMVKRNGEVQKHIMDLVKENFASFALEDGDRIEAGRILQKFDNRVVISGAIMREGEYELTPGLTLKQLIEKANGLRGDAFLNRALIFRKREDLSQVSIPIDLGALMQGSVDDLLLHRDDLVSISSKYDLREEYSVQIKGEVQTPGVYTYFEQMSVQDLLILSGGFKDSASGALIEISRRNKVNNINSVSTIVKLSIDSDLSLSEEDHLLQPFDQVYIRKSPGYQVQNQVTLEGEVLIPGEYTIEKKDERISDIINRASGLTPYAYPRGAILIRKAEFSDSRANARIGEATLRSLRRKILAGESEPKSNWQRDLLERLDVIEGLANQSNQTDLKGSRVKKDLIEDITEQDSLIKDIKIQESEPVALDLELILSEPGSKYDLTVKPGDVISIPGALETVRVAGEVTSPLNLRYDTEYSFKDYIYQSGGFLTTAKRGKSYIQYPNGKRMGVKRFLWFKRYPKVEPGSTIFVSRKPDRQPVNFQTIIAAAGSVATLALLVDRLSN